MREQEVRNLWEAYLEVCENQQLDEVSDELVGRSVNARIARSGAANDAEMRDRTPENMRASVRAGKKEASMKTAAAKRRKRINNEETDLFDTILEHLVAEGYADTNESALAIMANMSDEWRQSIVLDERNRGEQGMSDREVSRRRNLGGNTRSTVSSDALGDHGSQGAIQKFHNRKGKLRQSIHKSGRNTRGDTGESGGKGRYEANKDHTDGYPSITKRGQGPG